MITFIYEVFGILCACQMGIKDLHYNQEEEFKAYRAKYEQPNIFVKGVGYGVI